MLMITPTNKTKDPGASCLQIQTLRYLSGTGLSNAFSIACILNDGANIALIPYYL